MVLGSSSTTSTISIPIPIPAQWHCSRTSSGSRRSIIQLSRPPPYLLLLQRAKSNTAVGCVAASKSAAQEEEEGGGNGAKSSGNDEQYRVLTKIKSLYNDIVIVDTSQSRMLLLDSTHNVHSIFNKGEKWTGSYWDEFACLPAIIPKGPISILGLGGGTAAQLMLDVWPSLQLEGWEIDQILIDKAREYLGLSDLEQHTQGGGTLHVHIGDAFSSSNSVPGGYAGIVVDLFSNGKVLPQLQEVETWLELNDKLMPDGRLMVNCGAADDFTSSTVETESHSENCTWEQNSTIRALCRAFPGQVGTSSYFGHSHKQVSWKKLPRSAGENDMALTGPLPDLTTWSSALPDRLSSSAMQWTSCLPS